MNRFLSISIVCLLLSTVFAQLGHLWFVFDLFSPFLFYYVCYAFLIFIFCLIFRKPLLTFLTIGILLANLYHVLPIWSHDGLITEVQASPEQAQIKLLHANVLLSNNDYDALLRLIEKERPDVISLQELTPKWAKAVEVLKEQYPFHRIEARKGAFGIALFSKIKADIELLPLKEPYSASLLAGLHTPRGRINVLASHPIVPVKPSWFHRRNQQLDLLGDYLHGNEHNIIVGDFNITRWSPVFRRWQQRLNMKNARDGFGLVATWPSVPLIAIDHCLVSQDLEVKGFRRGNPIGSDHWPIIVDLSI